MGLVSAVLLFLALRVVPGKNTKVRYALGIVALLTVFIGGLVAWELPNEKVRTTQAVALQETRTLPENRSPTAIG